MYSEPPRSKEKRHGLRRPTAQVDHLAGALVHVHPHDLREVAVQPLAVAELVAGAAAVAVAPPEEAVGPEDELAAVVVRRRVGQVHQHARAHGLVPLRARYSAMTVFPFSVV